MAGQFERHDRDPGLSTVAHQVQPGVRAGEVTVAEPVHHVGQRQVGIIASGRRAWFAVCRVDVATGHGKVGRLCVSVAPVASHSTVADGVAE